MASVAALAAMTALGGSLEELSTVMVYYAAALLSLMVLSRATLGPLTRLVS